MKKKNENEMATAMKAGAVEGGAERISLDVAPGSTEVSEENIRGRNTEGDEFKHTILW